jgi:hypothetical protein
VQIRCHDKENSWQVAERGLQGLQPVCRPFFCEPTTARRAVLYSPVSAARKGKPNTGILFTGEAIPVNEK